MVRCDSSDRFIAVTPLLSRPPQIGHLGDLFIGAQNKTAMRCLCDQVTHPRYT